MILASIALGAFLMGLGILVGYAMGSSSNNDTKTSVTIKKEPSQS